MTIRISTGLRNRLLGADTNLVTNGAFTSDTTSWAVPASGYNAALSSVAGGQSGNCMKVEEVGGVDPAGAYQDITTKLGHKYKLSVYFNTDSSSSSGKILIGTTADEDAIWDSGNLTDTSWTLYTYHFEATATTTRVTFVSNDATATEYCLFDTAVLEYDEVSVRGSFRYGFLHLYSGTQPTSANDAPTGVKLCTFYSDGSSAGLEFTESTALRTGKPTGVNWTGSAITTGTAGYFRLVAPGDSGALSTTDARIDGTVTAEDGGGDLEFGDGTLTSGELYAMHWFNVTVPAE
jgi:hypothetical protein